MKGEKDTDKDLRWMMKHMLVKNFNRNPATRVAWETKSSLSETIPCPLPKHGEGP